ncbi:hypothetical protein BDD12DRAFT_365063 [Trichophaea hybrida]|nr:hypothetical protein BDD12DRAFT_365063 [Trichophaea hybrida]
MIKNLNTHILSSLLLLVAIVSAMPSFLPPSDYSKLAYKRSPAQLTSEAYTRCISAGIDPHGPHPDDFDNDDGEKISFRGESKFALWAAAQSEPVVGLKKKDLPDGTTQPTGVDVVMWTNQGCSGRGNYYYNVHYNTNYYDKKNDSPNHSMQINAHSVYPYSVRIYLMNWVRGTTNCVDANKDFSLTIYAENGCANIAGGPYSCFNPSPNQ